MTEQPDPVRSSEDVLADLGMLDAATMRLRAAEEQEPVLYALSMAFEVWDHVDRRGWRSREQVVTAARHMAAVGRVPAAEFTDAEVDAAIAAGVTDPKLIEADGSGRYRSAASDPEFDVFGVGSSHYLTGRRAINDPRRLSPLEMVNAGNYPWLTFTTMRPFRQGRSNCVIRAEVAAPRGRRRCRAHSSALDH